MAVSAGTADSDMKRFYTAEGVGWCALLAGAADAPLSHPSWFAKLTAEGVGFEPTVRKTPRRFSKPLH